VISAAIFGVPIPVARSWPSSAFAEMSGSSRHGVPWAASAHCVVPLPAVLNGLVTPGPRW
jgi:hypothetical protein